MNKEIEVLESNSKAIPNSFIYFLHEKSIFDKSSFWEYYHSLLKINRTLLSAEDKYRVDNLIIKTYGEIFKSFIFHLYKNDGYFIENFPEENMEDYIIRIDDLVQAYFGEYEFNENLFDDELKKSSRIE